MPFFPTLRVILIILGLMLGWTAVRADPGTFSGMVDHLLHTSL